MKKKIMLIEDEDIIVSSLRIMLGFLNTDYEFIEAKNGLEGFAKFCATEKCLENSVRLIFMDFNMPELNGLQALSKIREQSKKVRIILMSGDHDIKQEALNLGADYFLEKPFNCDLKELLVTELKKWGGKNDKTQK